MHSINNDCDDDDTFILEKLRHRKVTRSVLDPTAVLQAPSALQDSFQYSLGKALRFPLTLTLLRASRKWEHCAQAQLRTPLLTFLQGLPDESVGSLKPQAL